MLMYRYIVLALIVALPQVSQAGWKDFFSDIKESVKKETRNTQHTALPQEKIVAGLKQALNQGVEKSVKQLGRKGGFMKDASVKIPMPRSLKKLDKGLRNIGQKKVADKFIQTMNRAAEDAVPATFDIFINAIKAMSLKDAVNILNGEPDAATQYFKRYSISRLRSVIKPVVSKSTSKVGLTSDYKKMVTKVGFLEKYIDRDSLDIDQYITNKAIDGLFVKIALEEKRIRKDPVARTSDILKEVFK